LGPRDSHLTFKAAEVAPIVAAVRYEMV